MEDKKRFAFTAQSPMYNREIITSISISKTEKDTKDEKYVRFRALWDTGATNSVVTKSVAERLGLTPTGMTKTNHAGGVSFTKTYLVNLLLPNNVCIPNVRVSECENQEGRFDAIIGMDIISLGYFSISGQGMKRMVSFCLPSMMQVNYVEILSQKKK